MGSDSLIALAYLWIPITLYLVARRRRDLPFSWMLLLFGGFIVACGMTHAIDVWTLWNADYWVSGGVKAITAAVSVSTAIVLVYMMPRLLALPSVAQLQSAKDALEAEVAARRTVEAELRVVQAGLQERVLERTAALAETTALLNSVWNAAPVGLAIFDAANHYVRVNPALASMNGATVAAHQGRSLHDLVPALAGAVEQHLKRVRLSGVPLLGREVVGPTPASTAAAAYRVSYFSVDGERAKGLVGAVCEDISSQRLAEAERARALEDAEEANRAKDQFMARVSHELRTPLQVMSSWVALLRSGRAAPDMQERALNRLEHSVRMQARMITDLLDLARAVSGKMQMHMAATDPGPVVARAVDNVAGEAADQGVDLTLDAAPGSGVLHSDGQRLEQVLNNLLANAVKYTPRGGSVRATARWTAEGWQFNVVDTGIGIDAVELEAIFQPFRRGAGALAANGQGLGLGLYIARNITEQLGGCMLATSGGPGRGSTFSVLFPSTVGSEHTDAATSALQADALQGVRILLVEDDPTVAKAMRQALEALGAQVRWAAGPHAARAHASAFDPEVLVTDLGLADGENGLQVLHALRSERPGLPALACTAYGGEAALRDTAKAGFDRHLVKPVDAQTLGAAILAVLRSRHTTAATR